MVRAYTRCDHVLRHGDDIAVVAITKAEGKELFRPITDHRILALPGDVDLVVDPTVDVINPSSMARVADAHPGRTVVVEGLFGHVSFVMPNEIVRLDVLDVVPPRPSSCRCWSRALLRPGPLPGKALYERSISTSSPPGYGRRRHLPCEAWTELERKAPSRPGA